MTDPIKTDPKKPAAPVVETPERFTLKTGTVISVDGVEARLVSDTEIESDQSNHDKLAELAGTTFAEYPKRVTSADGVEKNVNGPEEEEAFLNPPTPPPPPPQNAAARKSPLDDVTVEHDDPADRARHTRTDAHKKR